jgi:hypothetical protein
VPGELVGHEGRDEVVAVVVTLLHPQGQGDAGSAAGVGQQLRAELLGQEIVRLALVDQQVGQARAVLDQRDRVVTAPCLRVGAEIAGKRLVPPRHLARCDDRCEGGAAAEPVGVAQRDRQRAVAAHRMAHDPLTGKVDGKDGGDDLGQLVDDVAVHAVIAVEGRLRRVDVEAGAEAEIISARRVVGHAVAARRVSGATKIRPSSAQARRYSPLSVTLAWVQVRPDRYQTTGRPRPVANAVAWAARRREGHVRARGGARMPYDMLRPAMGPGY